MSPVIRKAVKTDSLFRVGFCGPSKSGKTFSMLAIALGYNPITGETGPPLVEGGKVGLIDSERNAEDKGESEKYADLFDFDIYVMSGDGLPEDYNIAIRKMADKGYNPLIIDGISPEWVGQDGCLQVAKRIAKDKYRGDTHRAWDDVNVLHDGVIKGTSLKLGIKNYPGHVFVSVRAKTKYIREEYVVNENTGRTKTKIVKVGMGPIQRPEIDYEFDTFFNLTFNGSQHVLSTFGETRIHILAKKEFLDPGPEVTAIFLEDLKGGKKK